MAFRPFRILRRQRGIAMQIALFAMLLMTFIAVEVSYDTNVEYIVSSQEVNRLKAYYAAKAAVEISLLRIAIYQKVMAGVGNQLGDAKNMLDPIWNFPFAWPPSAFLPDNTGLSQVDKDLIKTAEKNSFMDTQYSVIISSEGSKIDINDLGSPIEGLAKATQLQVMEIFQQEIQNNPDFAEKYRAFQFDVLINHIADWVDPDDQSRNGGAERTYYKGPLQSDFMPPNQSFRTVQELHMVAEMKDEIFDLLAPRITVYGINGINVNYAPDTILKLLDRQITDQVIKEINDRRNNPERGGPFKNLQDFTQFLGTTGVNTQNFNQQGIPLVFDAPYNFRIEAVGTSSNVTRKITAVTFDLDTISSRFAQTLNEEEQRRNNGGQNQPGQPGTQPGQPTQPGTQPGQQAQPGTTPNRPAPRGRPTVVYWEET